jgi:hypothetical protein
MMPKNFTSPNKKPLGRLQLKRSILHVLDTLKKLLFEIIIIEAVNPPQ